MKCYKVQRIADGLFWEGNSKSFSKREFTVKGKTWKKIADVKSAISLYTQTRSLSGCDIVEYELLEVSRQKV